MQIGDTHFVEQNVHCAMNGFVFYLIDHFCGLRVKHFCTIDERFMTAHNAAGCMNMTNPHHCFGSLPAVSVFVRAAFYASHQRN